MTGLVMPELLLTDLAGAGLNGHWYTGATEIPSERSCYALLIGLDAALYPDSPPGNTSSLPPGWYLYAGSAHGIGGMSARVRHHFRKDKKMTWHIDRVTPHAAAIAAHIVGGEDECDIIGRLASSFAFDVALQGFGSSDCSICPAHLLVWKPPEARPVR